MIMAKWRVCGWARVTGFPVRCKDFKMVVRAKKSRAAIEKAVIKSFKRESGIYIDYCIFYDIKRVK